MNVNGNPCSCNVNLVCNFIGEKLYITTKSADKSELEAVAWILKPDSLHLLIFSVFIVYCFVSV